MKKSILFLALGLMMTLGMQAGEKKVYTSYNSGNNTLTYYYDDLYDSRPSVEYYTAGDQHIRWVGYADQVQKVVVDASMKNALLTTMYRMFYGGTGGGLINAKEIKGLENLNTANVTDMTSMFSHCSKLSSLDLSHFNTVKVKTMENMFDDCESLLSLDLSSFNTTNVKTMACMFNFCMSLTTINLSSFNTMNVQNMYSMFSACYALTSIDLNSFNTTNVTNMNYMFAFNRNIKVLDLDHFDVTNVKYMKGMFTSCASLETIYCTKDWSKKSSEATANMFNNCLKLKGGKGTTWSEDKRTDCYLARLDDPDNGKPGYFSEKICLAPTNLTISNITQSSATISWTSGDAADTKWVLCYQHENASDYTRRVVTSNPYTLSDLRFNSKYRVWVSTHCGDEFSASTPIKTFNTQPKSASDYVIVSSCAFKGFDPNTVQYGMTWTTEASSAIVQAMSPVDANAVYSLATGGTLYKKNDNGTGYTKVANGTSIGEGIYIYVTMVNILPPESENYRFPKSDEGITVVVNVDDQQWNANPKNYNVTDQLSQITINSPDFTVTAPIPDDPQALADARALLEEMIDNYNYLAAMLNELGVGAEILAAMDPYVASAQAVLDNPNATLTEIQDAITTVENEAAKYEQEMLNLLAPYEFEVVKNEAIEHLDKLLLPDDSEDCKKIIEDAKAYVASLTYNNSKSAQENLDDLDDALRKLYAQIEDQLEACRSKVGCEPPTDFKVSDVTSTSATLSWQPGSPKQTKYALTVIKMGVGPYWDFEQDIEATSITLTDLEPNTKYEAELEAYCSEGTTDYAAPGWIYFTTLGAQGIEGVQSTEYRVQKILRDGQLFIIRGDKTYTVTGQEVK